MNARVSDARLKEIYCIKKCTYYQLLVWISVKNKILRMPHKQNEEHNQNIKIFVNNTNK